MSRGIDILGLLTSLYPERAAAPIDGSAVRRLLIVKLSSIGDVVHALPVATALKRRFPALRITWAIEDWTAPLVAGHPAIDRVVIFPNMMRWPRDVRRWRRDFANASRELRREPYDVALDLQGLAKSAIVSTWSRAPVRWARARQREGAHLVSRAVPLPPAGSHAVIEYLELARALGANGEPVDFGLRPDRAAAAAVNERLASYGTGPNDPIVVITPSAAQARKDWPIERWAAVANEVPGRVAVVVAGQASQRERHAALVASAARPVIDLTGATTLAELVALLGRATLHVAPDSGPAHISAALGVPVISLYGPTSPARLGPFGQRAHVIEHRARCGAWCSIACRRQPRCLMAIATDEVAAAVRHKLIEVAGA